MKLYFNNTHATPKCPSSTVRLAPPDWRQHFNMNWNVDGQLHLDWYRGFDKIRMPFIKAAIISCSYITISALLSSIKVLCTTEHVL